MKGKPLQSRRKTRKKHSEELASDNFIECIAKNSKVTEQEIKYIFEFSCVSCVELLLGNKLLTHEFSFLGFIKTESK